MTEPRSLRIEKVPASTLVCIKWNGGGEVPAALSGNYTSRTAAQRDIELWKLMNGREDVKEDSPPVDEEAARHAARKLGRGAK